jgi:hypothetical protein
MARSFRYDICDHASHRILYLALTQGLRCGVGYEALAWSSISYIKPITAYRDIALDDNKIHSHAL